MHNKKLSGYLSDIFPIENSFFHTDLAFTMLTIEIRREILSLFLLLLLSVSVDAGHYKVLHNVYPVLLTACIHRRTLKIFLRRVELLLGNRSIRMQSEAL